MKLRRRGALAAALIAACGGLTGGSASASITPDPYSFGDQGTLVWRTLFGTSGCDLAGLRWMLSGVSGGATGVITGFGAARCTGEITAGHTT